MGSEEGGSERSIQLGGSYIVNGSCLPYEAQYIALGHVHKPQVVPGTNKKARYSTSLILHSSFGFTSIIKHFLVIFISFLLLMDHAYLMKRSI